MTQRVRFLTNCFKAGVVQYEAGRHYPLTPETLAQVRHGSAELVDMTDIEPSQHATETAAALHDWNLASARTVAADPALRSEPNPAATLAKQYLSDLAKLTR